MQASTRAVWQPVVLAVAGLTLVGFALRLSAMGQSLYGDEVFAFHETGRGLEGIFDALGKSGEEVSPPLYFVLAEGARQLGDPTVWIRLPSLVFGTATVPVVYAFGRRTFGNAAGLVAAAFVALSPFAIWYSTEARPYATMAFLVSLSTLALLYALGREGRSWWIVYLISALGALYTHYTAVFAILAQASWAFWVHREQVRTLVIVHVALALAYLPWLPMLSIQSGKEANISTLAGISRSTGAYFDFQLRVLCGHPFLGLGVIPGRLGLILLAIAGATATVGLVVRHSRIRGRPAVLSRPDYLLPVILALATPLGLAAYGAVSSDLYNPRNLIASMPALATVAGWVLTSLKPRLAMAAFAVALAALIIATARTLDEQYRRPATREVAQYIDRSATPGDPVITRGLDLARFPTVSIYFKRAHPLPSADADVQDAWEQAARGRNLFLVAGKGGFSLGVATLAGPGGRFPLREGKVYPGLVDLGVGRYSGEVGGKLARHNGRLVIRWSLGRVVVRPGVAKGAVDSVSVSERLLKIVGWAIDATDRGRTDTVLLFFRGRLLAIGRLSIRSDVAKTYGAPALISGYTLESPLNRRVTTRDLPLLRVFALVGGRASELDLTMTAKRAAMRSLPR